MSEKREKRTGRKPIEDKKVLIQVFIRESIIRQYTGLRIIDKPAKDAFRDVIYAKFGQVI